MISKAFFCFIGLESTSVSSSSAANGFEDPLKHLHQNLATQANGKKDQQNSYLKELEAQIREQRARKEQEKKDQVANILVGSIYNVKI